MSQNLVKRLEKFRKKHNLSILAFCRLLDTSHVNYHRWKKAKKITGPYKKIIKDFLDKNEAITPTEIKGSQAGTPQSCPKATSSIAVIGIACYYPGASTVKELWENILARRIQFRRILDQRLPLKDYYAEDLKSPDTTYLTKAALIDGFEFNWSKLRIPKKTFESTDIVHWLALDTALKAFEDAGYNLDKIPIQNTGVILGNTLTGEQTRSQTLRLRWPYVQRTLNVTLESFGIPGDEKKRLSEVMENIYKSAFHPITEDSLAGGLANTIAGRICNYLNFKAGGYIVDGACSSSLLAVATAANALQLGQMDLVLAGGVDISIDPFELVGFSKAGALAKDQMQVYDRKASGFIPGEGCGFVVLKRLEDALKDQNYIYAVIKGWGISSDGRGGMMEPSVSGQSYAIQRAYKYTGYTIADVDFVEGHGTGTTKGDKIELEGIARAMREATKNVKERICGVTSFKSIVGHTKAAAGIGGFIKAVLAVNQRILPPTANCQEPNEVFEREAKQLYPIIQGRIYPKDKIMRAGISSAGFGGINCHITIESKESPIEKIKPQIDEQALFVSSQNTEVFVFASQTVIHLLKLIHKFKEDLHNISIAEMADLSSRLNLNVKIRAPVKVSVVTDTPEHLYEALCALEKQLQTHSPIEGEILEINPSTMLRVDAEQGRSIKAKDPATYILLGNSVKSNRIGFLFPGQGSQQLNMTRTLIERFSWARKLLNITKLPLGEYIYRPLDQFLTKEERERFQKELSETEITQPAVVFSSLIWTEFLSQLGIEPQAVGGHSLGELLAFYKARAFGKESLLKFAEFRGKVMADKNSLAGMLSLFCDYKQAEALVKKVKGNIVIANINSPKQTVVSGGKKEIEEIIKLAEKENISTYPLPVSNAFHSVFMQPASKEIASSNILKGTFKPANINVYSGMSAEPIKDEINLKEYFAKQVITPVNFLKTIESMSKDCDLFIEVGPGRVLTNLVKAINKDKGPFCFPIEGTSQNDRDLNITLAQVFVRGVKINWENLYKNRLIKPFIPVFRRKFIENQCERPLKGLEQKEKFPALKILEPTQIGAAQEKTPLPLEPQQPPSVVNADSIASVLIELTHKLTGFDKQSLNLNLRLLDDLNLDSIKAAELIGQAGKILGLTGQIDPSQYSNYTLQQIRNQFLELKFQTAETMPMSVFERYRHKTWVRDFILEFTEEKIKQRDPDILNRLNKITILCDESQEKLASVLKADLKNKTVEIKTISETKEDSADSDCLIYLLPANENNKPFAEIQLKQIIEQLHRIMTLSTQDSTPKAKTTVFVQFGAGNFGENEKLKNIESACAKSFASTLHLERPDLSIKIIDFDQQLPSDIISKKIIEELQTPELFSIAGYDKSLKRKVPIFQNTQPVFYKKRNINWTPQDVVLVTGGAKGITAECALQFAKITKARMILVGRTKLPAETNLVLSEALSSSKGEVEGDQNNEVIRTLDRFKKEKLQCQYYSCDVTNLDELTQTISKIEKLYGRITAVIHGAGLNTLKRLKQTNPEDAYQEVLPKVIGAVNICKILEKNSLKLVVGITSVIGVTGMEGSGWYGLSNEILNLFLHQFKAKHKGTEVVAIAYSVWDEVGMGMRLGSLDWLLNKGISLIPVEEGIKRFMNLIERDSGSQQTVVVARVGELDTWRSPQTDEKRQLRFIEDIKYYLPGVELIVQAHLNIKDDSYVLDHNWKGTLLFPFVFGLEAMTEVAVFLTGKRDVGVLKARDIHLDKPITVNQESATRIEIHAQVLELKSTYNDSQVNPVRKLGWGFLSNGVKVDIYSDQDNFKQAAFSAVIEITEKRSVAVSKGKDSTLRYLTSKTIDLNLEQDVYGKILFQGKSFQCINRIHNLFYDEKKRKGECIFTAEYNKSTPAFLKQSQKFANQLLIGDPFFIDSLFQSMQLIIPQDLSLPRIIEGIDINVSSFRKEIKECFVRSHILKISNEQGIGNAEMFRDKNLIVKVRNCDLKILQTILDRPSANDLVDPTQRDKKIIEEKLNELLKDLSFTPPVVQCLNDPVLKKVNKEERHRIELSLMRKGVNDLLRKDKKQPVNLKVNWDETGRPLIVNKNIHDIGVSVSHDNDFLVVMVGYGQQGCDVESMQNRKEHDWLALLGEEKFLLAKSITTNGDELDLICISIWATCEIIKKAKGSESKDIKLYKRVGSNLLFECGELSSNQLIAVLPVSLTRGLKKVVCVLINTTQQSPERKDQVSNYSLASKLGYNEKVFEMRLEYGPEGQLAYVKRFPVTFRSNQNLSRNVYFTNYYEWMGQIREYGLYPIMKKLFKMTSTGIWGIATNNVKLTVLGELQGMDVVEVWLWMEKMGGLKSSVFDWIFEWRKILPDSDFERVALSKLRISWIKFIGRGQASVEELPPFIRNFMEEMRPMTQRTLQSNPPKGLFSHLSLGHVIVENGNDYINTLLHIEYFKTALEDSNLIGNIYFTNYAIWMSRTFDAYFHNLLPEFYENMDGKGEFLCLQSDIDYLREATPFDTVSVKMYMKTLYQNGADLIFTYHKVKDNKSEEKLSVGYQKIVLVKKRGNKFFPLEWPLSFVRQFKKFYKG